MEIAVGFDAAKALSCSSAHQPPCVCAGCGAFVPEPKHVQPLPISAAQPRGLTLLLVLVATLKREPGNRDRSAVHHPAVAR